MWGLPVIAFLILLQQLPPLDLLPKKEIIGYAIAIIGGTVALASTAVGVMFKITIKTLQSSAKANLEEVQSRGKLINSLLQLPEALESHRRESSVQFNELKDSINGLEKILKGLSDRP